MSTWNDTASEDSVEAPTCNEERAAEVDLVAKALYVIGSPAKLASWMQAAIPALHGQTPYSLLGSEDGRKQVETVLGRIEHGIY